ncbi:MAG: hypothetical protein ACKVQC_03010, partial [Elusimicrobiota bacterium]
LQSFAQVSSAIRIEGASTLLENEPIINGNQSYLSKTWKEIIHQTKMKNPHVLFFADNSGQNNIDWENFGFDYYENNQLLTLLTDQINRGDAGQLNKFFNEENLAKIKRSIFNLSHISSTDLLPTTRHRLLAACLIGLLPGIIQHDDNLNTDLEAYISEVSKMAVIRYGKFKALPTTSHHVFSFARAHGHDLLVAVVNLSIEPIRVNVFLDSFVKGFDDNKMYLVSNPLQHIPLSIESIQSTTGPGPTMAIWGNDFKKNGLSTQLDKLSIRLFSVNLSHPILHDTPEPIQQFHKV